MRFICIAFYKNLKIMKPVALRLPKGVLNQNFNFNKSTEISQIEKKNMIKQSKFKILLFGGADFFNDGTYGTNLKLAEYLEVLAPSDKYKIELQKGDIRIVNSPIFGNDIEGKDIYKEILKIIKNNFDLNNGILILYGYSWGGQLLMEFLKYFEKDNIKINLLITIDAAKGPVSFAVNNNITNNVKENLNIFQKTPSVILSRGSENEGENVKNINLTDEKNSEGEKIVHSNIDEYTLLYCCQIILYALKKNFSFKNRSENQIKNDIKLYDKTGF
jgi:hypothetical protein